MKNKNRLWIPLVIIVALFFAGYFGTLGIKLLFADRSWIADFGYQKNEIHRLTFHLSGNRSCPEIPVFINEKEFRLGFDTGCGSGLSLTNALEEKIDFELIDRTEELNRDGTHRGWSKRVALKEITVFGEAYEEIETGMADWKMFSSSKFNGIIGLEYFQSKVITLDYRGHEIAVCNRPVDVTKLDPDQYIILPLHKSTREDSSMLPFFQVEHEGKPAIAYLDTGKNYSYVYNPSCDYSMSDRPSGFTDVPIKIGSMELTLKDVAQVNNLAQTEGLPYPTMIELNSDQIWKCGLLVTIDLIDHRIIFRKI
jgi:hypothetical protein